MANSNCELRNVESGDFALLGTDHWPQPAEKSCGSATKNITQSQVVLLLANAVEFAHPSAMLRIGVFNADGIVRHKTLEHE